MKHILLFSLMAIGQITYSQTIPNGNFESWIFNGWNFSPENWNTDNSQVLEYVSRDTMAYQGQYAMRVTSIQNGLGGFGEASIAIPMDEIPAGLNFFVKSQHDFGFTSVSVIFLDEDVQVYSEEWSPEINIIDWTAVSIPFSPPEQLSVTTAIIIVTAQVGDLVPGEAMISVDEMVFEEVLGSDEKNISNITVYPNPASDWLSIDGFSEDFGAYIIYDVQGKQVTGGQITNQPIRLDISDLSPGNYNISVVKSGIMSQNVKLIVN